MLVKVTLEDDSAMYINPDMVCAIGPVKDDEYCMINMAGYGAGAWYKVKGSMEQTATFITHFMKDYHA